MYVREDTCSVSTPRQLRGVGDLCGPAGGEPVVVVGEESDQLFVFVDSTTPESGGSFTLYVEAQAGTN